MYCTRKSYVEEGMPCARSLCVCVCSLLYKKVLWYVENILLYNSVHTGKPYRMLRYIKVCSTIKKWWSCGLLMCLAEESGRLMSSLCKINALLKGSGCGGWGKCKGCKGSWLQARDLRGWGICPHKQGVSFPSKILSFNKYVTAWFFFMRVQNKKELSSLCRLKINHVLGSVTCIYSWYNGPHGKEQLKKTCSTLSQELKEGVTVLDTKSQNIPEVVVD
jgi:hypothetical protein